MLVSVAVNGVKSVCHKGSLGVAKSTIPDVCKTPAPNGAIPIPYPIIVSTSNFLKKGTKTVKTDKKMAAVKGSQISRCMGDEPGMAGGVVSGTNMKEAKWITYSFNVKMDGKNVCRLSDKLTMNHRNTVCMAGLLQAPVVVVNALGGDQNIADELCTAICECKDHVATTSVPTKQACVANKVSSGWPVYEPNSRFGNPPNFLSEATYEIPAKKNGMFKMLRSGTGRGTGPGGASGPPAPASVPRAMNRGKNYYGAGNTVRWDHVIVKDPRKPATQSNVSKFVEVKFKGDKPTANQAYAKKQLGKSKSQLAQISEEDCDCP